MSTDNKFQYKGKRVLVVGGATGMGAASAELALSLGADVLVMDYADVTIKNVTAIKLNLADKASIDTALASFDGPLDCVFSCAGVADGTPGIENINFVGHRYLVESLADQGRLSRGASICFISSAAGLGWEGNFVKLGKLLDIRDFDEASAWMRANGMDNYLGTKQAVCAYVAREALTYLKRGIRINAICPGPTDTPLAQANKETWLAGGADYRQEAGVEASTPMEQAYPLVFLCSDAAAAITGITLLADLGWLNSGLVHSFPPATPIAEFLLGRKVQSEQ